MFRETDIVDCLLPVVGWRQNSNPEYIELPPSLLVSETGKKFQDEHPLVNIENLDQASKNYDRFVYPDWVEATTYYKTQKVKGSNDLIYESLADANQGNDPTGSDEWLAVDPFAQAIEAITRSSISKVVTRMFTEKKLNEVTKTLIENVLLFDGVGSLLNKEIKQSRFVGLQIVLSENRDLGTVIRRLGTQFSEANPDFKLYIFHSSQETPIYIVDLDLTKTNSFEWSRILVDAKELTLRYNADEYAPGGLFFIGYYEDDLVGMAINRQYNFADAPSCSTCNKSHAYWSKWSQYMEVAPFFIASEDLEGILPADDEADGIPKLWDINKNQYQYTNNYGLNLDLMVRCDTTEFLCRERVVFADVISKQVAVDVLNLLAYSTRNNVISKETRELAIFALGNKDNGTPGLEKQLDLAMKAVSFEFSNLNSACLPCNDKYGSNWKTI